MIVLQSGKQWTTYCVNQGFTCLAYRCWTWSSPTWPCGCPFMFPMSSTHRWEQAAGSTLTCSPSCGWPLSTTLRSSGRRASAAPRRLSSRVCSGLYIPDSASGFWNHLLWTLESYVLVCVAFFVCLFAQGRCTQPACVSIGRGVWWSTSAPRLVSGVCLWSRILEAELVRSLTQTWRYSVNIYLNLFYSFSLNSLPSNFIIFHGDEHGSSGPDL